MQQVFFRKPTKGEAETYKVRLIQDGYPQVTVKQARDGYWEVVIDTVKDKGIYSESKWRSGERNPFFARGKKGSRKRV